MSMKKFESIIGTQIFYNKNWNLNNNSMFPVLSPKLVETKKKTKVSNILPYNQPGTTGLKVNRATKPEIISEIFQLKKDANSLKYCQDVIRNYCLERKNMATLKKNSIKKENILKCLPTHTSSRIQGNSHDLARVNTLMNTVSKPQELVSMLDRQQLETLSLKACRRDLLLTCSATCPPKKELVELMDYLPLIKSNVKKLLALRRPVSSNNNLCGYYSLMYALNIPFSYLIDGCIEYKLKHVQNHIDEYGLDEGQANFIILNNMANDYDRHLVVINQDNGDVMTMMDSVTKPVIILWSGNSFGGHYETIDQPYIPKELFKKINDYERIFTVQVNNAPRKCRTGTTLVNHHRKDIICDALPTPNFPTINNEKEKHYVKISHPINDYYKRKAEGSFNETAAKNFIDYTIENKQPIKVYQSCSVNRGYEVDSEFYAKFVSMNYGRVISIANINLYRRQLDSLFGSYDMCDFSDVEKEAMRRAILNKYFENSRFSLKACQVANMCLNNRLIKDGKRLHIFSKINQYIHHNIGFMDIFKEIKVEGVRDK